MTPSNYSGFAAPKSNISGYKSLGSVKNFTPQQMQLFQSLLGAAQPGAQQGLGYLGKLAGGDEEAFAQSEAPAYSAFDKLLGQIGSRYAGVGALGSSSFQNATSGAAGDLAQNLGARRQGIQTSAIESLLGQSEKLLGQKPYEEVLNKKHDFLGDFGNVLGQSWPIILKALLK
jgi:hypothetical protein